MFDETDISREMSAYNKIRAQKVVESLQKRRMNAQYAADKKEAREMVMKLIPEGAVVARGDSISLDQIDVLSAIIQRNRNILIDPFKCDEQGHWPPQAERIKMFRETFSADIFITGSNAITLDGKIVNIDGAGNRVAAMIFGPGKVILVIGVNKIVKDVDEALKRIHDLAAPVNATRHYLKHHDEALASLPCVKTGTCAECRHEMKICNYTVIIDGAMPQHQGRINVVLVGEELGI
jgi:hypothetical protein